MRHRRDDWRSPRMGHAGGRTSAAAGGLHSCMCVACAAAWHLVCARVLAFCVCKSVSVWARVLLRVRKWGKWFRPCALAAACETVCAV